MTHRGATVFMLGLAVTCSRNSDTSSQATPPGDGGEVSPVLTRASASASVGVVKRELPFDGGVAQVESAPDGAEHVLLIDPDGGVIGESWCVSGPSGYDAVREFFTVARAAALSGDRERIADLIEYPLNVNEVSRYVGGSPKSRLVSTREQFLREYSTILTDDVLTRVREAEPGQVSCSWRGHDLGDGVLWAELGTKKSLLINAINVGPPVRRRPTRQ